MIMTLEDYFIAENKQGKIDFALRAHVWEHEVTFYIRPIVKVGETADFIVQGNTVVNRLGLDQYIIAINVAR